MFMEQIASRITCVLQSRTPCMILVNINGQDIEYELLCILDFNNVRKRMSVIVRHNHKITLYCKGADSTVYERLDKVANSEMMELTLSHLNVSNDVVVELYIHFKVNQIQYKNFLTAKIPGKPI